MDGELLSLKWNNHKSTFLQVVGNLRVKASYTDATLACNGKFYPVHRLVLSSCSEYFNDIFEHTICKSPVVVLKDIDSKNLEYLLDYMYIGEVNVRQNELGSLVGAAECLKIKGLAVPDEDSSKFNSSYNSSHRMRLNSSRSRSRSPISKRRKTSKDNPSRSSSNSGKKTEPSLTTSVTGSDKTLSDKSVPMVKLEPTDEDDGSSHDHTASSKFESEDGVEGRFIIEKEEHIDETEENSLDVANSLLYDSEEQSWRGDDGFQSELVDAMVGATNSEPSCSSQQQDQPILSSLRKRRSNRLERSTRSNRSCRSNRSSNRPRVTSVSSRISSSNNLEQLFSHYEPSNEELEDPLMLKDESGFPTYTNLTDFTENSQHDQEQKDIFSCHLCQFTTDLPSMLNFHLVNHKGEKRFKCSQCDYKTADKSHLIRHYRRHTGERPYTCIYCNYRSSDTSTLRRHILVHLKKNKGGHRK